MQQTGVILTVTPQITNNRQIQMKVHVENSDVQFQANDVGAVFPTQNVDNEVLVADGETAVMGGLTQTTVSVSKFGYSDSRRSSDHRPTLRRDQSTGDEARSPDPDHAAHHR